jgi:hypothetical protein
MDSAIELVIAESEWNAVGAQERAARGVNALGFFEIILVSY